MFKAVEKIEDDGTPRVTPFAKVGYTGNVRYGLTDSEGDDWTFLELTPDGELHITSDMSEEFIGFDDLKVFDRHGHQITADAPQSLEDEDDDRPVTLVETDDWGEKECITKFPLKTGGVLEVVTGGGRTNPELRVSGKLVGYINHNGDVGAASLITPDTNDFF